MIFLLSITLLPPRKLSSVSKKEICMLHYILTSYFSCMFVHIGVPLSEVAEMLCGRHSVSEIVVLIWRWAYLQTKN
jgi:hypothetical protein